MEEFLSLNTLSFLHSHSDQIKVIALTLICFLNLLLIPFSQFPNILVILLGGSKVEATWMTDHIDLATLEEQVFNCFILMTKNTLLISMPIPLCKIIFR
jgi:hypothetical protein